MLAVSTVLTLLLSTAPVAEAEAWSLERVVSESLAKSPEVASARAQETGAEGELEADGRWLRQNPELEVEYGTDAPAQNLGERRLSVALSQTLEVAGQRGLRVERAEAALAAARAQRRAVELRVARAAADAAAEWVRFEAHARLAEEALAVARALEEASERRFTAGDAPEVERNAAALERARAEARAVLARSQAVSARAMLNRLLGRAAPSALSLRLTPLAVPSELRGEQPELVAAQSAAEAARVEVELLRRERIPDPTVSLGYERETRPEEHATGPDLHTAPMVVARLSVPLPLWNRNQGELAAARARRAAREAEREAQARQVEAERVSALEAYKAASAAEAALTAVLPGVERNLVLVQRAYEAGQLGLDAFLLARDRAYAARGEAIDASAAHARARSALLEAFGHLPTGEALR
ncbi:TolC family protein [Hyalangium rubrum]|uniref:TolC family protein n=1 Tax=Hyalangium rubrum TaxID=3103134 RepID=A0ABU5H104_9BACT|nr:TolC family protein [Hyalangium sp. s54d21]MDY7227132.1 TolC family protein [Hyalangium sp. s54d21]